METVSIKTQDNTENIRVYLIPEFTDSPVPMEVAQKVLHMDADQIRNRMESGILNIGFIFPSPRKRGKRAYRNTYISPKKFWEVTGYVWKGGIDDESKNN